MLSSAAGLEIIPGPSRTQFRDRLNLLGFIAEPLFSFILEHCSESSRNRVHLPRNRQ